MLTNTETPKLRAIVADDEPLARAHLVALLREQGVSVEAEASNGEEVLRAVEELKPDALFLDISMPGETGIELARKLNEAEDAPAIVFVTGFSEYAVEAFERDAADYLLKPTSPERLSETLQRLRNRRAQAVEAPPTVTADSLAIRQKHSIRIVPLREISHASVQGSSVVVFATSGQHRTTASLADLESRLPSDRFLRIHASCIVCVDRVREVLLYGNHLYAVLLDDGVELPLSRSSYPDLQRRLGFK